MKTTKSYKPYTLKSKKTGQTIIQYPFYLPLELMDVIKAAAHNRRCTMARIMREALGIGLQKMGLVAMAPPDEQQRKLIK